MSIPFKPLPSFKATAEERLARSKVAREAAEKARREEQERLKKIVENTLSPEQIKNWRKILFSTLGPYAMVMSDDEVQLMRDRFQERVSR